MRILSCLLFLLGWPALQAFAQEPGGFNPIQMCEEKGQPVFAYSSFLTDSDDPSKRLHEFWLDTSKDTFKAWWVQKGQSPIFLVGQALSKTEFFLCSYTKGNRKPLDIYHAAWSNQGLLLNSMLNRKIPELLLQEIVWLPQARNYSLRYDSSTIEFKIKGKATPDKPTTCETSVSSFAIVPLAKETKWAKVNKELLRQTQEYLNLGKATKECLDVYDPPSIFALSVSQMYASDRYLSAKIDLAHTQGGDGNLDGSSLNWDFSRQARMDINAILDPKDQKKVLGEVKRRVKIQYGAEGRLTSLKNVDFSFSIHSLVVSFAPVDENGIYLSAYRVDIPIPLDVLFKELKIRIKGPFEGHG